MKKLIPLMAVLSLWACTKQSQGEGSLSFEVDSVDAVSEVTKGDVADYAPIPAADDFHLVLTNYASQVAWEGDFKDWDPSAKFMAGEYTATLTYGSAEDEGPAKPFFKDEKAITVVAFESTPVTMTPSLANCIVKVKLGEYLKNYFQSWDLSLTTGAGNSFDIEEGDAIFMDTFKFTLEGTFTLSSGKTATLEKTFDNLAAATCYTVGVETTNVGGLSFQIFFDDTVDTITIEEDLN